MIIYNKSEVEISDDPTANSVPQTKNIDNNENKFKNENINLKTSLLSPVKKPTVHIPLVINNRTSIIHIHPAQIPPITPSPISDFRHTPLTAFISTPIPAPLSPLPPSPPPACSTW